MGRAVLSSMSSIQQFSLSTTASPTLQGAVNAVFGVPVMACDIPEPCKFPSLDSCQNRLLWTQEEVDLAAHPDVGLVLQSVGDAGKCRRRGEVSSDRYW